MPAVAKTLKPCPEPKPTICGRTLFTLTQKVLICRAILQEYLVEGVEIARLIPLVSVVSAVAASLIRYMHGQYMGAAVGG
jgi:hypothetical protein